MFEKKKLFEKGRIHYDVYVEAKKAYRRLRNHYKSIFYQQQQRFSLKI